MSTISSSASSATGDDSALAAASRGVRRYGQQRRVHARPPLREELEVHGCEERRDADREIAVGAQHERERARGNDRREREQDHGHEREIARGGDVHAGAAQEDSADGARSSDALSAQWYARKATRSSEKKRNQNAM